MSSIATKTGDSGKTGLAGGLRLSKSDLRVEAYGTVDELNTFLGFARSICPHQDIHDWTRNHPAYALPRRLRPIDPNRSPKLHPNRHRSRRRLPHPTRLPDRSHRRHPVRLVPTRRKHPLRRLRIGPHRLPPRRAHRRSLHRDHLRRPRPAPGRRLPKPPLRPHLALRPPHRSPSRGRRQPPHRHHSRPKILPSMVAPPT